MESSLSEKRRPKRVRFSEINDVHVFEACSHQAPGGSSGAELSTSIKYDLLVDAGESHRHQFRYTSCTTRCQRRRRYAPLAASRKPCSTEQNEMSVMTMCSGIWRNGHGE